MKRYNNVLLIDDDQVSCFINNKMLKAFGIADRVHTVHNGQEALHFIKENCHNRNAYPELILLDLHMPVMNGFEFIEDMMKLPLDGQPVPQVVILTSSSNPVDREKADNLPVKGYINKPLRYEELSELLG